MQKYMHYNSVFSVFMYINIGTFHSFFKLPANATMNTDPVDTDYYGTTEEPYDSYTSTEKPFNNDTKPYRPYAGVGVLKG